MKNKRQMRRIKRVVFDGQVHYTVYGFACETGFAEGSIYNFFNTGELTKIKRNGRTYISQSNLEEFKRNNDFPCNNASTYREARENEQLEIEVIAEEVKPQPEPRSSHNDWSNLFLRFVAVAHPEVYKQAKAFADADFNL